MRNSIARENYIAWELLVSTRDFLTEYISSITTKRKYIQLKIAQLIQDKTTG